MLPSVLKNVHETLVWKKHDLLHPNVLLGALPQNPEVASLSLSFSPQCSLQLFFKKMTRAVGDI